MANRIQRELALLLTGKDVSMSRTVRGAEKSMARLNRAGAKAGSNIARNAERAVVVGAVAATGAVAFAVNQAMTFESSSASVRKTVEGNVDAILAANRKLATATGLDVNALNEISATAGALGVAKDDIDDFTKTVALLGVTTDDVTTDLGATSLGHLKTTLGLAGADFEHFGNTLVYLGNNGASTEGQILSMAENIAGAASTIGASTPQVLGWAAAVANTGEEAEAGGSSIQRFWLESFKHVNAGGKELKLMAKVTGMTGAAFQKAFGKDASGTLVNFMTGLGKLSKAEQLATLEALGFKDIRITRALLKLLANTDNLTDSLADSTQGWTENNAATNEAAKRFETTAQKLEIFKANVNDAAITIGSELLPVLADLSTEGTAWIQDHQAEIHQFAQDLSRGVREAVKWAQQLDWEAIGGGLETAATAGKMLIDAFTGAPAWLQGFLITGFLANKFSGGAVMDVAAIILSQAVRGVLGMNAGVVNIRAGTVVGGGGGAGAGAGGGGGKTGLISKGFGAAIAGAIGLEIASLANEGAFNDFFKNTPVGIGWTQPELRGQTGASQAAAERMVANGISSSTDLRHSLDATNEALRQLTQNGAWQPLADALYGSQIEATRATARTIYAELAQRGAVTSEKNATSGAFGVGAGFTGSQANQMQAIYERAIARGKNPTQEQIRRTLERNQARAAADAAAIKGAAQATAAAIRDKDLSITIRNSIVSKVWVNARQVANATAIQQLRANSPDGFI